MTELDNKGQGPRSESGYHALLGERFTRLTVVKFIEFSNGRPQYECLCDCGNSVTVSGNSLKNWNTRSCGCFKRDRASEAHRTHGLSGTPEYTTWKNIRHRCGDADNPHYGGRNILLCERWQAFENFLADMGQRPSPKHTIERVNNDGNYEPSNCIWATRDVQYANTRANIYVLVGEEKLHLRAALRRLKVSMTAYLYRKNKKHETPQQIMDYYIAQRGL